MAYLKQSYPEYDHVPAPTRAQKAAVRNMTIDACLDCLDCSATIAEAKAMLLGLKRRQNERDRREGLR
ncbi:MAG: hypothetical protein E6Q97_18635 [Desulfurellales bacterium]|nr:MAG: hypothetical protein E6Q97_18635 [Desulfurellales bacterium]